MPVTQFESVGKQRLSPKGSRAAKELALNLTGDLQEGQGRLLSTGEIVLNIPGRGLVAIRADQVTIYTPKVAPTNPLAGIVSLGDDGNDEDGDDDTDSDTLPSTEASSDSADNESDEAPLISRGDEGDVPLGSGALGNVTSGKGIGTY